MGKEIKPQEYESQVFATLRKEKENTRKKTNSRISMCGNHVAK